MKIVLGGEDNDIFSTLHPVPDIKEKHKFNIIIIIKFTM
jgi:hypothetical protein